MLAAIRAKKSRGRVTQAVSDHPVTRFAQPFHAEGGLLLGLTANRTVAEALLNQCLYVPNSGLIIAFSRAHSYQAVDALADFFTRSSSP